MPDQPVDLRPSTMHNPTDTIATSPREPAIPRYAVIGNPVAHSWSPRIHEMFAQSSGLPMQYERLLCPLDAFATTLSGFARHAKGCNVTVPFKGEAFESVPRATARAQLAQAANTLRLDGPNPDDWLADNTDGAGLLRDLQHNAARPLRGQAVLLIGAGGAAAGALGPLLEAEPHCLVVANRTLAKAQALVERHRDLALRFGVSLQACALQDCPAGFDVVINASASSLNAAAPPVAASVLKPGTLALDMMYGRAAQPFLAWAQIHGALGRDGLGMLVEQAAEAWVLWRGIRPETGPVLQALRAAVDEDIQKDVLRPGAKATPRFQGQPDRMSS
jgi:shikimate dehydrogenase